MRRHCTFLCAGSELVGTVDEAPAKARNRAGVVAVDPDDRTHLSVPLERLPNGAWAVRWRVLSRDGRGARGRFEFRVIRDRDGAY